jgi:hypothetical protein
MTAGSGALVSENGGRGMRWRSLISEPGGGGGAACATNEPVSVSAATLAATNERMAFERRLSGFVMTGSSSGWMNDASVEERPSEVHPSIAARGFR